jgi:hypothetical protein
MKVKKVTNNYKFILDHVDYNYPTRIKNVKEKILIKLDGIKIIFNILLSFNIQWSNGVDNINIEIIDYNTNIDDYKLDDDLIEDIKDIIKDEYRKLI